MYNIFQHLTVFRYSFLLLKFFCPQTFIQIHLKKYQILFGVGTMLKGAGTVPPSSKYDIHSLLLANFHSTSAFSLQKTIRQIFVLNTNDIFSNHTTRFLFLIDINIKTKVCSSFVSIN
jgi:hypothetical protein